MSIRSRIRYCDRCNESLRGQDYMSAAGLDFHWPECSTDVPEDL